MVALDERIGLDEKLQVLVKLRASLINGCVSCIDLHSKEGLAAHENVRRLFGLAAWRESSYFSERERAALDLTDAITLVVDGHVPGLSGRRPAATSTAASSRDSSVRSPSSTAGNRIGISARIPAHA